ncbi:hypothetical protein LOD99_6690 [Oopsacas minuta]|uniref:Uncharacterized protein n=1 Tax=Oopsacas minuta TaxID=111878 RepID=A0AAV7JM68_9METZ|nr:hypothetical protein LOD99_6690 [Oopsacas minuta]
MIPVVVDIWESIGRNLMKDSRSSLRGEVKIQNIKEVTFSSTTTPKTPKTLYLGENDFSWELLLNRVRINETQLIFNYSSVLIMSRSQVRGKPYKLRRRNPKNDTYLSDPFLLSPLHFQCQAINELAFALRIFVIFANQDKKYEVPFLVWDEEKGRHVPKDPLICTEAKDLNCLLYHMLDTKSHHKFLQVYSVLLKTPDHRLFQRLCYFRQVMQFLSHPQRLAPYTKKSREMSTQEETGEVIDVILEFVEDMRQVVLDPGLECALDNLKNLHKTFLSYVQYRQSPMVPECLETAKLRVVALNIAQNLTTHIQNDRTGDLCKAVIGLIQPRLVLSRIMESDGESNDSNSDSDNTDIGPPRAHSTLRETELESVTEYEDEFKPAKSEKKRK